MALGVHLVLYSEYKISNFMFSLLVILLFCLLSLQVATRL